MTDFDLVLELILLTVFSLLVVYLLVVREPTPQRSGSIPSPADEARTSDRCSKAPEGEPR